VINLKILSDKRLNVITAIILVILISSVIVVCFLPNKVVHISGGKTYEPYYSGDRGQNNVGLTFNVYEGSHIVEGILNVLEKNDAKATFFVGGCWADDNEEVLIKILEKGHEIGSHGYFHKDHSKLSENANREEMVLLHNLVKRVTGYDITLFAPPSGAFSVTTLKVAESLGYKTILWTKDTIDWRDKSKQIVYNRATKNVLGGDIVLMHPKQHTLDALPQILDFYKKQGLTPTTVSECIGIK
jgi:peptidoglycan/xylan/chitin deacetylase (PgdA/CDA1 family)